MDQEELVLLKEQIQHIAMTNPGHALDVLWNHLRELNDVINSTQIHCTGILAKNEQQKTIREARKMPKEYP
jgi:tRNA G37 N-methylase Trm5